MKDCEIANILYNMSIDMDVDDYADTYDIEVQEIKKSICKLKESHDILYPVLTLFAGTANVLYNMNADMDVEDFEEYYADVHDVDMQELEKSICKLKENHDILYPVLVSIAETHTDMFDFCKDQD